MNSIPLQLLGQAGCCLHFPEATIYVDPYLSNSVATLHDPGLVRLVAIPLNPEEIRDADWVLITHAHTDHCDPHTLPQLAKASPQARFIGPATVISLLISWGIDSSRLYCAEQTGFDFANNLRVCAVPAAHPQVERDIHGALTCVGYVIEYAGQKIYFSGDTFLTREVIEGVMPFSPIHTAFLPVNEHNFFREQQGILGNMSVREAFQFAELIGVRQLIPVHWDMFAENAVSPEEIRLLYRLMAPSFSLAIRPRKLDFGDIKVSYVIRTLNEGKHLGNLLQGIAEQNIKGIDYEVILVDSGSIDDTLSIAEKYACHIHQITREEFSFGRSLNLGCEAALGEIFVIVSGHCIPQDEHWAEQLCRPIFEGLADYAYGRQLSGETSAFSEGRIFAKYFGGDSKLTQEGFFCNNANSAISRKTWEHYRFDEELTGLEDMELAKRLVADGGRVAYVAEAGVLHLHEERWSQVRRRFEREAIALQGIMPQIQMRKRDVVRYIISSIWLDWCHALRNGVWSHHALDIVRYRYNQYMGSYRGNHEHRQLSKLEKEKYFYPN